MNIPDQFLSEEDLDLQNLTEEELIAYWNLWLEQAQATNDEDADEYSHGVFMLMKAPPKLQTQTPNRKPDRSDT